MAVVRHEDRTYDCQQAAEQSVVDPEAERVGVGERIEPNESHCVGVL